METTPLRCLFVASEVAGFAKTGGLADVASSLPRALTALGVECAVMLPLYGVVRRLAKNLQATKATFSVALGGREWTGQVWRSTLPNSTIPVFLVEQPELFERDDTAGNNGIYHQSLADGLKTDYADNSLRFGFLCRAVLESLPLLDYWPDILHLNDWQTGLVPVYLREQYRQHARSAWKAEYAKIRTIFTIHNMAYQGTFPAQDVPRLELPWRLFTSDQLEFYGQLNFLKSGLVFSDGLTTVSPTYAREIQTPYFGCGLHGVLLRRTGRLKGIVNGVDYGTWNPATDRALTTSYDVETAVAGKAACKAALQKRFGLQVAPAAPMMGMISRLVQQKGVELILNVVEAFLANKAQLVVLGRGDKKYEIAFEKLKAAFPKQVAVSLAQDDELAHQIESAADMFLMPSQFEPCGLNQLYSLKYGTIPIVRATGGLVDTVCDATAATLKAGTANGFSFGTYTAQSLQECIRRALVLYRDKPEAWRNLQKVGMMQDWSWNRSAREYVAQYESVLAG